MTTTANSQRTLTNDQLLQKQQNAQNWLSSEFGSLDLEQIQNLSDALSMAMDSMVDSLCETSDPVVFKKNYTIIQDVHRNLTRLL